MVSIPFSICIDPNYLLDRINPIAHFCFDSIAGMKVWQLSLYLVKNPFRIDLIMLLTSAQALFAD
jgi:hypothetical protein